MAGLIWVLGAVATTAEFLCFQRLPFCPTVGLVLTEALVVAGLRDGSGIVVERYAGGIHNWIELRLAS